MAARVVIRDADLRFETFRAGGKGGQHQNVTDSAVRVTYLPLGIRAESRTERSQHQNKKTALAVLVARVRRHYEQKAGASCRARYDAKPEASFGSQVRTYRLVDGRMTTDHRTGRTAPTAEVLKGKLELLGPRP